VPADQRLRAGDAEPGAAWVHFERAATAVLGFAHLSPESGAAEERLIAALDAGAEAGVPCSAGTAARDRLAYRLALVGYSARDVALILLGQASRAQIDAEFARGLTGGGRFTVLDSALARAVPRLPSRPVLADAQLARPAPGRPVPADLEAWVRHYAAAYAVDPQLVAAMIARESNWNQASQSPKGAAGLMQLMPRTAAMLKVDRHDAVDNIRGGIAYLAGLLRTYGDVRHALIAYNAGPTHANQVIRGERPLFGETRRYLEAIDALYPLGEQ
jgi:soluble lytic murein transglycosylase-like protein